MTNTGRIFAYNFSFRNIFRIKTPCNIKTLSSLMEVFFYLLFMPNGINQDT